MTDSLRGLRGKKPRLRKTELKEENVEKDLENDPSHIKSLWKKYNFDLISSTSRKERLQELLSRHSIQKLPEQKIERIKKRLETARKTQEESISMVEQLRFLMERLNLVN